MRLQPVKLTHSDIAFLQYTGGTTGVAKGAMLTHGNMVANVLQALEWIGPSFPRDPATLITALPLYHIFALTANCLLFVVLGWRNVLITNPRDFPGVRRRAAQVQVHVHERREHLVQCAAAHARLRHASISAICGSRSAAAWPCRKPSPSAGRK